MLNEYELGLLEDAYERTMAGSDAPEATQAQYVLYGSYGL